jgi:hypothetical protein
VVAADAKGKLKCYKVPTDTSKHRTFFKKLHQFNKERVERQLSKYSLSPGRLYVAGRKGRKPRSPGRTAPKKRSPKKSTSTRPRKLVYNKNGDLLFNWSGNRLPAAVKAKRVSIVKLRERLAKAKLNNSMETLKNIVRNAQYFGKGEMHNTKDRLFEEIEKLRNAFAKEKKKRKSQGTSNGQLPKDKKSLRTLKAQADAWFKSL